MTSSPSAKAIRDYMASWMGRITCYHPDRTVRTNECVVAVFKHFGLKGSPTHRNSRTAGRVRRQWLTLKEQGVVAAPKRRGHWNLTAEVGVPLARELNGFHYDPNQNLTSQFLADRLAAGLYAKLRTAIAKKFRLSDTCKMVDDHVHTYLTKIIQRDALRDRLLLKHQVYDSQIAVWCCRSAQNDIRAMGTNPATRTIYGAQTATERRLGENRAGIAAQPVKVVLTVTAHDRSRHQDGEFEVDFVDNHATHETELSDQQRADNLMTSLVDTIKAKAEGDAEDLLTVLRLLAQEYTAAEVAEHQGWTRAQANARITKVRNILKAARS